MTDLNPATLQLTIAECAAGYNFADKRRFPIAFLAENDGTLTFVTDDDGENTVTTRGGQLYPWAIRRITGATGSGYVQFFFDRETVGAVLSSLPITVFQGTIPWAVSQSGPWVIGATQSGLWTVQQGASPWGVSQSGLWTVTQGTSPWLISGPVSQSGAWTVAASQSGAWTVAASQSGAWTVAQGLGFAVASDFWSVRLSDGTNFYTAPSSDQLPSSLIGGRLDVNVGSWFESVAPTTGQKTSAASLPVVISSDQSPVQVTPIPYGTTVFGQTRIAAPFTLLDSLQNYYIDPNIWGTQTVGGGTVTYNSTMGTTVVSVTATNGDAARLRTHSYFLYQAGKETRLRITGFHSNAGNTNQVREWGYFETNNGIFFVLTGTTLGVAVRSSVTGAPVDSITPIVLPGFDLTKNHIYEISFRWLSAGPVLFWINNVLVATVTFDGIIGAPFMRTAVLPVGVTVRNTGASAIGSFNFICANVQSEGGDMPPEYSYSANNPVDKTVTAVEIPLLSIRPALLFQGLTNRKVMLPWSISVSSEGHAARANIRYNPTSLTGPVWTAVDPNSSAEFDTTATAFTGGTILGSIYVTDGTGPVFLDETRRMFNRLGRQLRLNAFATSRDVLTVTAFNEIAGNTMMRASGSWTETG